MSVNDNDTVIDTTAACQNADGCLSNKGSHLSYLKLAHTKVTSLHWNGQDVTVADAPADVFDAYISQVVEEIVNVDRDQWDIFERWHIINACLEADVLLLMELPEGCLILARPEEEERRSTTPLAYDPEVGDVTPEEKEV
jgi:hypothetical protein